MIATPMLNVLNGGRHADSNVELQELIIALVGAASLREGLRAAVEVFHSLKAVLPRIVPVGRPNRAGAGNTNQLVC